MNDTNVCKKCAAEMQRRDDELAALRAENARLRDAFLIVYNEHVSEARRCNFDLCGCDWCCAYRAALEAARGEGEK